MNININAMPSAFLYLRVSTDEQAITGFSLRNQLDRLTKYCLSNEIEITHVISEDYSARTFNRPAWSKLMTDLKKSSQRPNILLFTKWDRFSRNIAEAYYVIEQLKKLKITPQAIEQPLDLTIPENKIILAVYIASSEVDNDGRSTNVKQGIHKAREEGRWTSATPLGYMFQLTENGKKIIVPKEPEAILIRNAFNQAAFSSQNLHSIFKRACRNGLLCHVSHFWRMMKNPVYNGKVLVPPFEGNDSYWEQFPQ